MTNLFRVSYKYEYYGIYAMLVKHNSKRKVHMFY